MDRRSFVAMLGSIPFVNKLTMEALPEKEIEKIEALDEATLLVIRKAQALTDGFLTGFKNVKFELLTKNGDKHPMSVKKYTITNGIAKIQLHSHKIIQDKEHFGVVVVTYENKYISSFDLNVMCLHRDDELNINITLSIAC